MSYDRIAKDLENPAIKMDKLVQYAQGSNPLIPEFLALGEIKRRESLMQHSPQNQVPQTTVAQDLATKAMAPQMPMQQMPQQGIAGIPPQAPPQALAALPSGMGQQSFAGGGIVAFAGDKGSKVEEDDYPIFNVGDALSSVGSWMGRNWEKNKAIREGRYVPGSIEDESGRGEVTPAQATYSKDAPKYTSTSQYLPGTVPGGPTQAERDAFYEKKSDKPRAKASDAAKESGGTQAAPKQDMYSRYEEMLKNQAAETKAGRDQDKWMRLLEAGLGIMGGTSQYAATNIGQGAMSAAKGYAQDQAAARKEDRQNVMDLMNLGMKKEEAEREAQKLAMTEKLYGAHGRYYDAAAGAQGTKAAGAGTAANTRLTIAQQNLVHKYFQDLKKDINNSGVSDDVLMQKAMGMAGVQSSGNMPPAAPAISWDSLGKK